MWFVTVFRGPGLWPEFRSCVRENLNELFTSGLVEFAADLLMLAGAVAMMFYTNWKLATMTMTVTPLILLATYLFRNVARKRYREIIKSA